MMFDLAEPAAANGLAHKDTLRFRTPGLTGWQSLGI
jgi:hypothetical protein